jgi:hypothetical protein
VGGTGVYRNNIIRGGVCGTANVVREASAGTDPRIFENNDLDPFSMPNALYVDEGSNNVTTVAAVNALTDATFSANVSADCGFVSYPVDLHIGAGTACVNAGTATGAPTTDMDGAMRDSMPDIGADEL